MYNQPLNCCNPEPQPYPPDGRKVFCCCSSKVLFLLTTLLALTVGLILGAVFAIKIFLAFPALIVLAVVLAILIIALVIFRLCNHCQNKC
ncbi:MAG: hypothetical protein Q8873_05305 [Bacillota bacterium]|nr:hypothetical protein [Bacillota bacterium]